MRVKTAAASKVQLDRRTTNELRRFLEDKRLVLMESVRSMISLLIAPLGRNSIDLLSKKTGLAVLVDAGGVATAPILPASGGQLRYRLGAVGADSPE